MSFNKNNYKIHVKMSILVYFKCLTAKLRRANGSDLFGQFVTKSKIRERVGDLIGRIFVHCMSALRKNLHLKFSLHLSDH